MKYPYEILFGMYDSRLFARFLRFRCLSCEFAWGKNWDRNKNFAMKRRKKNKKMKREMNGRSSRVKLPSCIRSIFPNWMHIEYRMKSRFHSFAYHNFNRFRVCIFCGDRQLIVWPFRCWILNKFMHMMKRTFSTLHSAPAFYSSLE